MPETMETQAAAAAAAPAAVLPVYVLTMSLFLTRPCFREEISELIREMTRFSLGADDAESAWMQRSGRIIRNGHGFNVSLQWGCDRQD